MPRLAMLATVVATTAAQAWSEQGGMMYLSRGIEYEGRTYQMVGAIPGDVRKYGEKVLPYVLAATGVGTVAATAIQAALAARQIVLAKKAAKQAAGMAEAKYNTQLNDAYAAYTKEAKEKGIAPVPFPAFKTYIETGSLPASPMPVPGTVAGLGATTPEEDTMFWTVLLGAGFLIFGLAGSMGRKR